MFGRSWVRFLSGTQIFSLSHARVIVDYFIFHKVSLDGLSSVDSSLRFTCESADIHKVAPKENKVNTVNILEANDVVNGDVFDSVIRNVSVSMKIDPGAPSSSVVVTEGDNEQGFAKLILNSQF